MNDHGFCKICGERLIRFTVAGARSIRCPDQHRKSHNVAFCGAQLDQHGEVHHLWTSGACGSTFVVAAGQTVAAAHMQVLAKFLPTGAR